MFRPVLSLIILGCLLYISLFYVDVDLEHFSLNNFKKYELPVGRFFNRIYF